MSIAKSRNDPAWMATYRVLNQLIEVIGDGHTTIRVGMRMT